MCISVFSAVCESYRDMKYLVVFALSIEMLQNAMKYRRQDWQHLLNNSIDFGLSHMNNIFL